MKSLQCQILTSVIAGTASFAITACRGTESTGTALPPATAESHFDLNIGPHRVSATLAVTERELRRGLMHRADLSEDHGMLFVYRSPDRLSFWMRNTRIPLDIGFFDSSGRLVEIYPLYAFDETPVKSRSNRIQFALEVNLGWFAEHGLKPGVILNLDAVGRGLQARGFALRAFRLER